MELKQYAVTLWKWSWLIALSTALAAVSSFWATSRMPRVYATSTTLMVGRFIQTENPTGSDFAISQQLAQSYIQLVRRQPVLQATIEALGLEMGWQGLAGKVHAGLVPGTQLIQINVQDTDPQRAKVLADEVARQLILQSPTPAEQDQAQRRQFVQKRLESLQVQIEDGEKQIEELNSRLDLEQSARGIQDIRSQIDTMEQKISSWQNSYASLLTFYQGSRTNFLSVVEPASVPTKPVSPKVEYFLFLAAASGFALATGAAFVIEYLDNTIKDQDDVDRVLQLPTLGTITRVPHIREPSDHLVTMQATNFPATEAYRVLRTNVQFSTLGAASSQLVVTSSSPGEGKTMTSSNLAITMAFAGKKVILVDADLRRPSLHHFFGVSNHMGLTSLVLDDNLSVEAVLFETPVQGLKLMSSGPLPPNPADLLGSEPMEQRFEQMKDLADVVIFDSPPILALADTAILGALCSGVILVVEARRVRSQVVRRAKESLDQLDLRILGVVLNSLPPRRSRDYYYSYYYSLGHSGNGRWRDKRRRSRTVDSIFGWMSRVWRPERRIPSSDGQPEAVDSIRAADERN